MHQWSDLPRNFLAQDEDEIADNETVMVVEPDQVHHIEVIRATSTPELKTERRKSGAEVKGKKAEKDPKVSPTHKNSGQRACPVCKKEIHKNSIKRHVVST